MESSQDNDSKLSQNFNQIVLPKWFQTIGPKNFHFEMSKEGYTPMMLACTTGNEKIIRILIANVLGRKSVKEKRKDVDRFRL